MPHSKVNIWAIIPARFASTRLSGKPLIEIAGKPLIRWTWEAACNAKAFSRVIIATDDMRIADSAIGFGAEVAMTSPEHASGTDRIAEVVLMESVEKRPNFVINIQGDEPLITPRIIEDFVWAYTESGRPMGTIAAPASFCELDDPSTVKVVIDKNGDALYFSRTRIPFNRDSKGYAGYLKHIGIYGYKTSALLEFAKLQQTPLESAEKLEQLRALEHSWKIYCSLIPEASDLIGVDTVEDLKRAETALRERGELA